MPALRLSRRDEVQLLVRERVVRCQDLVDFVEDGLGFRNIKFIVGNLVAVFRGNRFALNVNFQIPHQLFVEFKQRFIPVN